MTQCKLKLHLENHTDSNPKHKKYKSVFEEMTSIICPHSCLNSLITLSFLQGKKSRNYSEFNNWPTVKVTWTSHHKACTIHTQRLSINLTQRCQHTDEKDGNVNHLPTRAPCPSKVVSFLLTATSQICTYPLWVPTATWLPCLHTEWHKFTINIIVELSFCLYILHQS